jgi:hypothetical protein
MTTITIDEPIKLSKTHFANPMEAAYFLLGTQIKHKKSASSTTPKSKKKSPSISQYEKAMQDLQSGKNIYNHDDLQTMLHQRWLIK